MNLNIIEERLRREHSLPSDFAFWKWECFPRGTTDTIYVEFTGGRCPLITRGPRKGKPNYRKSFTTRSFAVTIQTGEQWEAEYETD